MVRGGALLATTAVLLLAAAPASSAQERPWVVAGSLTPALVERENGGWTVDATLVNLTGQLLDINSQPMDLDDADCRPVVPATLAAAQTSSVTVRVPASCELTRGRFEFEIDAEDSGRTVASIGFVAAPAPDDEEGGTDWAAIAALIVALGTLALVVGAWITSRWSGRSSRA